MTRYDVIVVGAGFAGLSAAVRLAREGARVLVLEARSRLGGRATAFQDRETGELVDNGQHVLFGCYRETLAFLDEIGAREHVSVQPQLAVTMVDRDGARSRLDCSALPAPLHLVAGVFDWSALTWRDRWSVLRMAGPLSIARREAGGDTRRAAASPGETVENWLIRNGQTARLREMLWDPLAVAALNQLPAAAAAPVFARVLAEMFGGDPKSAAIVLPRRPLHLMYAEPARDYIEQHGGSVRTAAPASIHLASGGVQCVRSGTEEWTPHAVVCAVPWFAFSDAIQGDTTPLELVRRAADSTQSSPVVTVNVWFDREILDEPFLGLPGRAMQWVFDKRLVVGDSASHLTFVASSAADLLGWTNSQLIASAHQTLVEALPSAKAASVKAGTVIREPRATFSLAPGQPARPATITAVKGLLLAGDWIDTGLPATIEGAVRSGHWAAHAARS